MYNKNIAVLIVAAGTGERFSGQLPKQYAPLFGQPLLSHVIRAFQSYPGIGKILVAIHPDHGTFYEDAVQELDLPPPVIGGKTRQASVKNGIDALLGGKEDYVLVHDAARPCVDTALIERVCQALKPDAAVVPVLPVHDTLRRKTDGGATSTENRENLYSIQTPQGMPLKTAADLYSKFSDLALTDDAALFEAAGLPVVFVDGDRKNIKVTRPEDLPHVQETFLNAHPDIRTGKGYDVHRLVPKTGDRALKLGGLEIPYDRVLEGHSDSDVVLHALTDALLGTICDGDIGAHFSPNDTRWKNKDSAHFLKHAAGLVAQQGGILSHVDLTIICEAPKVGPHRDAMRQRIADILRLPPARVSVKATTTEGLGFTGRGEGIAAEALATVRLPLQWETEQQDDAKTVKMWGT